MNQQGSRAPSTGRGIGPLRGPPRRSSTSSASADVPTGGPAGAAAVELSAGGPLAPYFVAPTQALGGEAVRDSRPPASLDAVLAAVLQMSQSVAGVQQSVASLSGRLSKLEEESTDNLARAEAALEQSGEAERASRAAQASAAAAAAQAEDAVAQAEDAAAQAEGAAAQAAAAVESAAAQAVETAAAQAAAFEREASQPLLAAPRQGQAQASGRIQVSAAGGPPPYAHDEWDREFLRPQAPLPLSASAGGASLPLSVSAGGASPPLSASVGAASARSGGGESGGSPLRATAAAEFTSTHDYMWAMWSGSPLAGGAGESVCAALSM